MIEALNARTILQLLDYAGVAVFAVSGALTAGRKSLDLLGVVVIALVTATGGGTLRDLLLDRHPVFWIAEPTYLVIAVAAALLTVPYVRYRKPPLKLLQIADALGLAFFSISGAQLAESGGTQLTSSGNQMVAGGLGGIAGSADIGFVVIVTIAAISGCFGGVIRDVLCNDIPMILRRGSIYASAVLAGAAVYVLLGRVGAPRLAATLLGMGTIAGLRLAAITWNLTLPVFSLPEEPPGPAR